MGKSSLIHRYANGNFIENSLPITFSTGYFYKDNIQIEDFNIKLELMDCPRRNYDIGPPNFSCKAFVILVFDVSSKASFTILEDYIEEFNDRNRNPNKLLYVVGNKCDKEEAREVTYEEGKEFASMYELEYFETSALNGKNVDMIFK